jgi:hypothetical protein
MMGPRSVFLRMVLRRRMELKRQQLLLQNPGQRAKRHLPMGLIKKTWEIIWHLESVIKYHIRLS